MLQTEWMFANWVKFVKTTTCNSAGWNWWIWWLFTSQVISIHSHNFVNNLGEILSHFSLMPNLSLLPDLSLLPNLSTFGGPFCWSHLYFLALMTKLPQIDKFHQNCRYHQQNFVKSAFLLLHIVSLILLPDTQNVWTLRLISLVYKLKGKVTISNLMFHLRGDWYWTSTRRGRSWRVPSMIGKWHFARSWLGNCRNVLSLFFSFNTNSWYKFRITYLELTHWLATPVWGYMIQWREGCPVLLAH